MKARVVNGRWVLDDPTGLPEGTEVEIVTRVVATSPTQSTNVYVDAKIREYVVALLARANGADPRREAEIIERAQVHASSANRAYVTPSDVKSVALEVLQRFATSESIAKVLDETPVP